MYKFNISTSFNLYRLFTDMYFGSKALPKWFTANSLQRNTYLGKGSRVVLGTGVGAVLPRTCAVRP